ncbi:MAG TPA: molybdopterin-dependent oxidoreductase [Trebonia sp.]|jgi:DMSO/TMAO reductase YedYZ molybdopterin-dependent catalytic subunit|nr:molybdopterin-dependent oxidoreductase [Trebonia sp.]
MSDTDKPEPADRPEPADKPEQDRPSLLARWVRPPLRRATHLTRRMTRLPGRVKPLARLLMPEEPPPGPFRRSFWRSPVRGPWLTSVLGLALLGGVTIMFATGLLSYAAYNPDLGGVNDYTPGKGWLGLYLFSWPTDPDWLYRVNQGLHVTLGLALVPILLTKLWSVLPKLFEWPPLRSPAHALERISLFLLVGGGVFEFATGIMNIQQWYVFPGSFYTLHFYGAWVFTAAFVVHAGLKMPTVVRSLRRRRLLRELRVDTAHTAPESPDLSSLVPTMPAAPTVSRRGVLGFAGAGGLLLAALAAGQSIGGPLRRTALLAPHGQVTGSGPLDFQINVTAAEGGIKAAETGDAWRLTLRAAPRGAANPVSLTRAQLLAMPQHTASLAINCVEGWSTGNQVWTGVRLRDLARLAGAEPPGNVYVQSLQEHGGHAILSAGQVMNPDSLLAFRVNGAELSIDHGYPARVILPASPGVHNIKWVTTMTFGS